MTEEETPEIKTTGNFFSPYGVLLLTTAAIIDGMGGILLLFNLLGIPIDDFGILDMAGLILVGGLMFIGTGEITTTKGTQMATKKILKRLGLSFLIEIIPLVGSASPSWLVTVYFHLKSQ